MTRSHRRGFTLVELLVVITIIGMLMALLIPAVQMARRSAQNTQCQNNIRQVGQAIISHDSRKGYLPPYMTVSNTGNIYASWVPQILSDIGRNDLFENYRTTPGNYSGGATGGIQVEVLICPADIDQSSAFPFSYAVNAGMPDAISGGVPRDFKENGAMFFGNSPRNTISYIAGKDGASTTLLLAENSDVNGWAGAGNLPANGTLPSAIPTSPPASAATTTFETNLGLVWRTDTYPDTLDPVLNSTNRHVGLPRSQHSGTFNSVMCDGSTRTLSSEMNYRVYALIMTPQGSQAKIPASGAPVVYPATWGTMLLNEADLSL